MTNPDPQPPKSTDGPQAPVDDSELEEESHPEGETDGDA